MTDMNKMLLHVHEFHGSGCRESHTFLVGANKITSTCIPTLFLASTLYSCCSTAVVHLADGVATICTCRCGHKNNYWDGRLHTGNFLGPEGLNDLLVGTVDRGFTVQSFRIMYLQ